MPKGYIEIKYKRPPHHSLVMLIISYPGAYLEASGSSNTLATMYSLLPHKTRLTPTLEPSSKQSKRIFPFLSSHSHSYRLTSALYRRADWMCLVLPRTRTTDTVIPGAPLPVSRYGTEEGHGPTSQLHGSHLHRKTQERVYACRHLISTTQGSKGLHFTILGQGSSSGGPSALVLRCGQSHNGYSSGMLRSSSTTPPHISEHPALFPLQL